MEPAFLKVLNLNFIQNYYITLDSSRVLLVVCEMHPAFWCNPFCYGTQISLSLRKSQTTKKKMQHRIMFTCVVVSSLKHEEYLVRPQLRETGNR